MSKGIKALNNRGEITLCTAKNQGTGNCNHVLHQFEGMSVILLKVEEVVAHLF